jgi:TPP-dependent pyruvate/acetoin dehydrogenase alpha subunit
VVENNEIAQTTPSRLALAGEIEARARAFGVQTRRCASTDADEIFAIAKELVDDVRTRQRPAWFCIDTVRLGPHSKGDDTRTPEELEAPKRRDPLALYRARAFDPDRIDRECVALVESAYAQATAKKGRADAGP